MNEEDFRAYQMEMMRQQQEEMMAMMSEQMEVDSATITQYLEENNIDAEAHRVRITLPDNQKG